MIKIGNKTINAVRIGNTPIKSIVIGGKVFQLSNSNSLKDTE